MANRIEFNTFLKTICPNVYFQKPTNITMKYPAIVYSIKDIEKIKANNKSYKTNHKYEVTVLDMNPDTTIVDELMKLDYCEFDRHFVYDGINNFSFIIYY